MKIIFLDIDGVVCNQKCWKSREDEDGHHIFDQNCLKLLEKIIEKTEAKIVISSTWRFLGLESLKDLFRLRGFKYYNQIIDITGEDNCRLRGVEIYQWIEEFKKKEKLESYVIIDDDSDMLYWQRNYFVKTNTYKGINGHNANKAIKILNNVNN